MLLRGAAQSISLLDAQVEVVDELLPCRRAHVSWNARRVRADAREERFVTQRCHRTGDRRAAKALDALLAELAAYGYEVVDVEREYVLLDSGPELDEGWLEET
ncbi:hypothetical protein [Streptomyces sp. NPDC002533]